MDIAKGIGIILVILGHVGFKKGTFLFNIIQCFHMPLFFIISGYFFKYRKMKDCLKNNIKRLIIPYIITSIAVIFYKVIRLAIKGNFSGALKTAKTWILAALYGSGNFQPFGIQIIGAIWFLLALAFAIFFMNLIFNKKYRCIYVIIIAYIGHKTSKYIWLPWSVQGGMFALLFLYVGVLAKKYDIFERIKKLHNIYIYIYIM